jgi:hypothetical protein
MHDARHHDTATPRHHAEEIALLTSFCSSGGSFLVAMPSFPANDFHMSDLTPTVPRFILINNTTARVHGRFRLASSRIVAFRHWPPGSTPSESDLGMPKYLATAMCL